MESGTWFNKQNIFDNMYDFIRDINTRSLNNKTREYIYEQILDASTIHFECSDKALFFPMAWSVVEIYLVTNTRREAELISIAKEVWFEKLKNRKETN